MNDNGLNISRHRTSKQRTSFPFFPELALDRPRSAVSTPAMILDGQGSVISRLPISVTNLEEVHNPGNKFDAFQVQGASHAVAPLEHGAIAVPSGPVGSFAAWGSHSLDNQEMPPLLLGGSAIDLRTHPQHSKPVPTPGPNRFSRNPMDKTYISLVKEEPNGNKEPPFPVKLHRILSSQDFQDIVTWLPHGRAWRVLKPKTFEERIIPLYFRHTKYASFMRQVNGWGFKRMTDGPDHNSYYHKLFLRGIPELCEKMRREKQQKDIDTNPDFYQRSVYAPLPSIPTMFNNRVVSSVSMSPTYLITKGTPGACVRNDSDGCNRAVGSDPLSEFVANEMDSEGNESDAAVSDFTDEVVSIRAFDSGSCCDYGAFASDSDSDLNESCSLSDMSSDIGG